ncbi:MAG: sigma-70 family RNA polymerase sigma factor [Bacteroidota bacterium]
MFTFLQISSTKKYMMESTAAVLSAIRDGNESIVERIYRQHRPSFLAWARRHYPLAEEELMDVYQDAIIIMYQNVVEKKVTELRSTVSTYLFGIAKNLILKKLRQQKRTPLSLDEIAEVAVAPQFMQRSDQDEQQYQMRQALNRLGKTCRQILELFYYYEFSLEVIAERLQYKNSNTVKAQKHRCMKQLEGEIRN